MAMTITVSAALGQFSAGVLNNPDYSLETDGIKYVEKALMTQVIGRISSTVSTTPPQMAQSTSG